MKNDQQVQRALGLSPVFLQSWQQNERTFLLHQDAVMAFKQLQQAANEAGFNLQLVSAYRDFQRQLSIWNAKASGQKAVLDTSGRQLALENLSQSELMHAILRWSALPGLSRHHWGSDIDVYDANAMALADVQLVPAEVEGNGPCAAMHDWLSERIGSNASFGFFRPYAIDKGGIAPERWHISYLPVAATLGSCYSKSELHSQWQKQGLLLLEQVELEYEAILQKYVRVSLEGQPEWVKLALGAGT